MRQPSRRDTTALMVKGNDVIIEGENNYIFGLVIKNPNAKLIVNGQVIETK